MALAFAILRCYGEPLVLFKEWVAQSETAKSLRILELNEAGLLTRYLAQIPGRVLGTYPEVDIHQLPYEDEAFDLVVHSDTLEHVSHPIRALEECRRVLRPGGLCAFTVPIIVDRMTSTRTGLPPSYHGAKTEYGNDWAVQTEYGCDAWTHVIRAGFSECRTMSLEYPAGQALVGVK